MTQPDTFTGGGSGNGSATNYSDAKKKTKKEEEEEGKGKQQRKVSLLKLFSFADSYDYLLMAVGSVGACVHGASVPIFFIFFGKLINIIGMAYLFPKEASSKVAKVISTITLYFISCR